MALITVEQAVAHLKPASDFNPDDLDMKREQAEALVLEFMKITDAEVEEFGWTATTATTEVRKWKIARGAILEVLTNIYFDRGDRDAPLDGPISKRLTNQLSMQRDPTIA